MKNYKILLSFLCAIIILCFVPLREVNAQQYEYGKVDFEVLCNETVQADFNKAMAMLHNMMYVTAREDFKEITEADPAKAQKYGIIVNRNDICVTVALLLKFLIEKIKLKALQRTLDSASSTGI